MKSNPHIRLHHSVGRGQRGYMLMVLLLFMAILLIGLAAAAPSISTQIQRDREEELIHRGRQYVRAIKLFYKKFGRYPTRLEELENTNNIRFLRRRYKDPMTPDGKWRLIHFGEQTVTPTGLFGAPIGGGPAGTNQPGANQPGATTAAQGGFSLSLPTPSATAAAGIAAAAATQGNAPGTTPGTPAQQMGTLQPGAATLGGGPIVGVASPSKKTSIREMNSKTHYNEWEFVYDPRLDLMTQAIGAITGTPGQPTGPGQPISGPLGQPMTPGPMPGMQPMQPGTPIAPQTQPGPGPTPAPGPMQAPTQQ